MEKKQFVESLAAQIIRFHEQFPEVDSMELIGACAFHLLGASLEMNGILTFTPSNKDDQPVGIVIANALRADEQTPENLARMKKFVDAVGVITGSWGA